jgi:hypothetical protein
MLLNEGLSLAHDMPSFRRNSILLAAAHEIRHGSSFPNLCGKIMTVNRKQGNPPCKYIKGQLRREVK